MKVIFYCNFMIFHYQQFLFVSLDIVTRCQVCQRFLSNDPSKSSPNFCSDPSHRFDCYQHRRVHSVSHIEFNPPSSKSPEAARAMSCTPTRGFYSSSEVHSPVTFYSPGHPRLYSPVFPHEGGKVYNTGSLCYGQHGNYSYTPSFHESPSAMSSFSMESEHSMECQSNALTPGELAATRGDNWNYSTYSSAMSTGSDTSPAIGWRKNSEGGDPMKMQKVLKQNMVTHKQNGLKFQIHITHMNKYTFILVGLLRKMNHL